MDAASRRVLLGSRSAKGGAAMGTDPSREMSELVDEGNGVLNAKH